jgi:hypothetical protein
MNVAPGIRRLDKRIIERLEVVAAHFHKEGAPVKVMLVTESKSRSPGSYHASGRALDFHIDGVEDEAVAAFCRTMTDTGCGLYPNAGFVHMDARDSGAGHVSWIDISRPGETPKYVPTWPMPAETAKADKPAKSEAPAVMTKADPAPAETAKAETAKSETAKSETAKSELPALPAAATVVPMETPKPAEPAQEASPTPIAKKHHRHHHHRHVDHTI